MNFPGELQYTKEHEWIKLDGKIAIIGVTDFAQKELGDIVFIDINSIDQDIAKDGIFGTIEAVKTVSDLFLPVGGKVLEVNELLNNQPELVNSDPYGQGWIIKISVSNPGELNALLTADAYKQLIGA